VIECVVKPSMLLKLLVVIKPLHIVKITSSTDPTQINKKFLFIIMIIFLLI
jgi:hypothetical protein